jgi:hypothetical protein
MNGVRPQGGVFLNTEPGQTPTTDMRITVSDPYALRGLTPRWSDRLDVKAWDGLTQEVSQVRWQTQPGGGMTCPLCGFNFGREEQSWACQRCPLASGCRLIRCPQCGYEWAEESSLVNWFKERWHAFKRPGEHERSS